MDEELSGRASVRHIAEVLEVPDDDVLRALGGGWRPIEGRLAESPLLSLHSGGWWVTGEPEQMLLGVAGPTLTLARIVLRWDGPGSVSVQATDERQFAREDVLYQPELLAETVEKMARTSRKTFRWCRTCRTVNRPEYMDDRLECMACASEYRGVVF
jgi:hypothetical protein